MREGGQGTLCGWDRLVRAREREDVCWQGREEEVVVVVVEEEEVVAVEKKEEEEEEEEEEGSAALILDRDLWDLRERTLRGLLEGKVAAIFSLATGSKR